MKVELSAVNTGSIQLEQLGDNIKLTFNAEGNEVSIILSLDNFKRFGIEIISSFKLLGWANIDVENN